MDGLSITYIIPEVTKGEAKTLANACTSLIEKVKLIQFSEETKWEMNISVFEKGLKYAGMTQTQGEKVERIIFIQDENNERSLSISDLKSNSVFLVFCP